MTAIDTATLVVNTLNNPLVQLGMAGATTVVLAVVGYLVRTQPKARDIAQDLADLNEELEPWVQQAEKALFNNEAKFSLVEDKARAWLQENGVTGRRGRLAEKYIPALIELAVKKQPG